MKKYLIKYSYIPDDGVPIIKTDYAIVEAKSTEKAKQIFIASFPMYILLLPAQFAPKILLVDVHL